jgi:hypothetical protein
VNRRTVGILLLVVGISVMAWAILVLRANVEPTADGMPDERPMYVFGLGGVLAVAGGWLVQTPRR